MTAPLFAGFEAAELHRNGRCTQDATGHPPGAALARHYAAAIVAGAQGFRDALPERVDLGVRYHAVRRAAGERPVVWSACHFDRPRHPLEHARRVACYMGAHDRLIAVNEPSVGPAVSGRSRGEATALAAAMMARAAQANAGLRFWTCDPVHRCDPAELEATRALVHVFGDLIECVGINVYPMHATTPLRDLLRLAQDSFPDHRIALTETGWHDGHQQAEANWPGLGRRADWWRHVQEEIEGSGVQLAAACWFPWLDVSWEAGPVWPNGWPEAA